MNGIHRNLPDNGQFEFRRPQVPLSELTFIALLPAEPFNFFHKQQCPEAGFDACLLACLPRFAKLVLPRHLPLFLALVAGRDWTWKC